MGKLILMRHGQSLWNSKNLFTGWVDVPLTVEGIEEAVKGGREIRHLPIDVVFTSTLIRAQMTMGIALAQHDEGRTPVILHEGEGRLGEWAAIHSGDTKADTLPVYEAWELNERFYGDLQGLNKQETREKYGEEQVHLWRRSFDTPPPNGESLKMTSERTLPYFKKQILPWLERGKNVFIPAHGNSLRSIVMYIEGMSGEEVVGLEIPTGRPILYDFAGGKFVRHEKSLFR